jgi:hypothetical protein
VSIATIVSLCLGIPSIAIAIVTLAHNLRLTRSARYLADARGLFEMRDTLVALGEPTGEDASRTAPTAHAALLRELDTTARANVYYFQKYASPLRGASFPSAIAELVYGAIVFVVALSSALHSAHDFVSFVVGCVMALAGVTVAVIGVMTFRRRREQRTARAAIGVIDTSTVEGVTTLMRQVREFFRRKRG